MATLNDLPTPCLLLDRERMERNITRLSQRIAGLGPTLRPHLKTCKSVEVARRMLATPAGPATVSTLREAEVFAAAGVRDMIYAVGIAPQKLARVEALRAQGVDLTVILDSTEQAEAVAVHSRAGGRAIPALIEIDTDGHRAGVAPSDAERLRALAAELTRGGELRGVLTHAGASYGARGAAELERFAAAERAGAVEAAAALRAAGHACPVVSVGSTPTAHFARSLEGVTEVRAGVYVFFDLMMASLGVCRLDDIALSVLATVIGHRPAAVPGSRAVWATANVGAAGCESPNGGPLPANEAARAQTDAVAQPRQAPRPSIVGAAITDAGWMALSRDTGFSPPTQPSYGLACNLAGAPLADGYIAETSQEHGVIAAAAPRLAVGDRVRILPHHACATAAQFDRYYVLGPEGEVEAEWPRFGGW